jgi:catechol 2,3-dioxygenase-like lactoylglutathione lyase family enzyme
MSIQGVSHITFVVKDLTRATEFFCAGLGAREVYDSGHRHFSYAREKFFVLGGIWICTMAGTPVEVRSYQHLAFQVDEADLPQFEARLRAIGVEVKPPRPRVDGEGTSFYFYDFDHHLFELHTGSLETRLKRYSESE